MIHQAIRVLVSTGACLLIACAHPLQSNELFDVPTPEIENSVSLGETMVMRRECPCFQRFIADRTIRFDGRRPIRLNSIWLARYKNTETGELYLVSDSYHPALAAVLKDGRMNPASAMVQFRGAKSWRSWTLESPADTNAFRPDDYSHGAAWRLQYLGFSSGSDTTLRFSIEDISGSSGGERVGQIEYIHDLLKGREFVVRGMRVTIQNVGSDGILTYVAKQD